MNRIQLLPVAIIIVVLGCSRADQQQENKQATVSIHVDRVAKPYDPMIFGIETIFKTRKQILYEIHPVTEYHGTYILIDDTKLSAFRISRKTEPV